MDRIVEAAGIGLLLGILLAKAFAPCAHGADLKLKPPLAHSRSHLIPREIPKLPPGITCEMVHYAYKNFDAAELDYYTLMLEPKQLDAVNRCLKEKAV